MAAQKLLREKNTLARQVEAVRSLESALSDQLTLLELGEAEKDTATIAEAEAAITQLANDARKKRLETLLSGEADGNDTYVELNSGAGGTEACDWVAMMLRMYMRWAEKRGYKVELLEDSPGEEAGLKSATIQISGTNAYGWLKGESGVHRLVRISPFDANARRHTSFASVWVYPVIDDSIQIDVQEKDIQVDTMRASGAGGQHVNKTSSAVRMTHLPTGIVVKCQSDRSQHRNRAMALQMLKARIYEQELQRREAAVQAQHNAKTEIGWGHQIRSYVLQPYQMVKDLRTEIENGNAAAVLDGDIDRFLEGFLAQRV